MGKYRLSRLEEAFKEEISEIIQKELKDPRIGLVSVTLAKVSRDLRHAKVSLSILGGEKEKAETLAGLKKAKGFIRQELGKRIRMKFLPELLFQEDLGVKESLRLAEIFEKLATKDKKK